MEYKVYEVLATSNELNVGDEVALVEDGSCVVGVRKITLARKDNIIKFNDEKSYWFGSLQWVDSYNLRYLRSE
jgi:hypothetical protein